MICPYCDNNFEYQLEDTYFMRDLLHRYIPCPSCKNLLPHESSMKCIRGKRSETISL
nr:MAG TPA: Transcription initiation factor IIE, alpha FINGER, Transcription [Caudoviricetes sp.]